MDDLCVRFIINIPQEELESVERICFQVEEAQWFYEDFIRPLDPDLPSLNLKSFCLRIFQHCPILSEFSSYQHAAAFSEFLAYKTRVPVRGAILLNDDMDQVVLVKGWKKSSSWSFPRGKINKGEEDLDCAIREAYEETGFDLKSAGLVREAENMKFIEISMREQHMRLYVFKSVPINAHFEPQTRKEISMVQWYKLSDLPTLKKQKNQQDGRAEDLVSAANKFYMVAPFMVPLKKWILRQKKAGNLSKHSSQVVPTTANETSAIFQAPLNGNDTNGATVERDTASIIPEPNQSNPPNSSSDLPDISRPFFSAQDATIQLKSLLRVTSTSSESLKIAETSQRSDSNGLLALLKPKGLARDDRLPSTPMGKIPQSSALPPSPVNGKSRSKPTPALPSPPMFPKLSPKIHGIASQRVKPLSSAVKSVSDYSRKTAPSQRAVKTADLKEHDTYVDHHALFPYQRTGDPLISQSQETTYKFEMPAPSADKLPPPKLTKHSSALLDLFKSTQIIVAQDSSLGVTTTRNPSEGQFNLENNQDIALIQRRRYSPRRQNPNDERSSLIDGKGAEVSKEALQAPVPGSWSAGSKEVSTQQPHSKNVLQELEDVSATATSEENQSVPLIGEKSKRSALSKARTQHQENLLDLFQKSSSSRVEKVTQVSPQTLELPTTVVELSAQPSPGHSREPSTNNKHINKKAHNQGGVTSSNYHASVATSRRGTAPVFATVKGPLNVPSFETLTKGRTEAKPLQNHKKPIVSPNHSPMTVLSRPSNSPNSLISTHSNEQAPQKLSLKISQAQLVTSNSQEMSPAKNESQSRVLRQPAQTPTIPSPMQSLPSPKQISDFNEKPKEVRDHKRMLLSLFDKGAPGPSPLKEPLSVISPLSGSLPFQQGPSPLTTPLASRSRIGSINSNTEEARALKHGKLLPRTTPVDKALLLDYLEGVVSGKGT